MTLSHLQTRQRFHFIVSLFLRRLIKLSIFLITVHVDLRISFFLYVLVCKSYELLRLRLIVLVLLGPGTLFVHPVLVDFVQILFVAQYGPGWRDLAGVLALLHYLGSDIPVILFLLLSLELRLEFLPVLQVVRVYEQLLLLLSLSAFPLRILQLLHAVDVHVVVFGP